MTPIEFLDEIGLPYCLSGWANDFEKRWFDSIYRIYRSRTKLRKFLKEN
jgi:hypothetical protein